MTTIRKLRKAKGLTQKQLAELIGVTESAVNQYESEKKRPKYETLLRLCEALGCSVADLIGEQELTDLGFSAFERILIEKYRTLDEYGKKAVEAVLNVEAERGAVEAPVEIATKIIPLFPAAAGAGEPVEDVLDEYEVPVDSKASFAVRISGDSMEPEFKDGEVVLCRRVRPEVGDIAVIMVNGFLLVKQYITDGQNIYLRSLNRERKDLDLDIWASGDDTVVGYGTVIHRRLPLVKQ